MPDPLPKMPAKKWFFMLGAIAIFGHLVGMAADLYSGFAPSVDLSLGPITSLSLENIAPLFAAKDLAQALTGHYLAIFFIPLGILGIWQVVLGLSPKINWGTAIFLILGTLGIVYATFYHGTLAFITAIIQHQSAVAGTDAVSLADGLLKYANSLSEPLGTVLLIANFLVSGLYAVLVLFRKTFFPRWMAAFNPVSIQLALSALIWLLPQPLNQLLWLIVFNGSMAIWYVGTTRVLTKRGAEPSSRDHFPEK
jgi:hypothetical protein